MITINAVFVDTYSVTCICGEEIYCQEVNGELYWECFVDNLSGWLAYSDFE